MTDKWYEGTEQEQIIHFLQEISNTMDDIAESLKALVAKEKEQ